MTAPSHRDVRRILDDFGGKLPSHVEQMLLAYIDAADQTERALGNLLARIHRDGGHHQVRFGTEQSALDAEQAVVTTRHERDELRAHLNIFASCAECANCHRPCDFLGLDAPHAFRCADCLVVFCATCAKAHFGENARLAAVLREHGQTLREAAEFAQGCHENYAEDVQRFGAAAKAIAEALK